MLLHQALEYSKDKEGWQKEFVTRIWLAIQTRYKYTLQNVKTCTFRHINEWSPFNTLVILFSAYWCFERYWPAFLQYWSLVRICQLILQRKGNWLHIVCRVLQGRRIIYKYGNMLSYCKYNIPLSFKIYCIQKQYITNWKTGLYAYILHSYPQFF